MNNLIKAISSISNRINYVLTQVACLILSLLALGVTADVVMRYVFNSPILGVKQISEYSMVWLCFLVVGWVQKNRGHVAVTLIESWVFTKTKSRKRKYYIALDVLSLCYVLPLLWLSVREALGEYWDGIILTGEAGGAPAYIAHVCIPIGFLLLALQLIITVIANILDMDIGDKSSEREPTMGI